MKRQYPEYFGGVNEPPRPVDNVPPLPIIYAQPQQQHQEPVITTIRQQEPE